VVPTLVKDKVTRMPPRGNYLRFIGTIKRLAGIFAITWIQQEFGDLKLSWFARKISNACGPAPG